MLYLPVIHAGYEALFDRHPDAAEVLLLGSSFAEDFPAMGKEIRALDPATAARYLAGARGFGAVRVIERGDLPEALTGDVLVLPDEEIMRELVDRHQLASGRRRLVMERTFLRWDRAWSTARRPAERDRAVTADALARELMGQALDQAGRSSDWWRQVGAVAVRAGRVLARAHNEHRPTEYSPYLNGDPRNDFSRGIRADLSTAIHAEAAVIARAARDGLSLADAELFVSTFPCPACARLVAEAGIRRLYYAGPYAVLDGDAVLRAAGVELVWVCLTHESSA